MATAFCAFCGTQNFGTRFCENCGQPAGLPTAAVTATAASAYPYAAPAAAATPPYAAGPPYAAPGSAVRRGSPLNVVTLVSYLASFVISTLVFMVLAATGSYSSYTVVQVLTFVVLLVCGISATIAGFTSRTTPGRRAGGGMLGIFFLLLSLIGAFAGGSNIYSIVTGLSSVVLFLSWAVARPFRGPGYFALLIGIALTGLTAAIGFIPFPYDLYWLLSVLSLLGGVIATIVTVVAAMAFETPRHGAAPAAVAPGFANAQPGYSVHGARTNSLAIMSLVFGILGGSLVAIILGHIAKSQIRRTGEAGSGMATAGLILGYFWFVVLTIIIVIQVAGLIALSSAMRSYGY